jgi:MATE family multidrug resistance protein
MDTSKGETLTHRTVLSIAVPVMISNVSTPLIGIVDTGVVGQIPDPAYIGAVAIGSLVFLFLFWAFGFLRMGTTGLTAQALGAGNDHEVGATLARALLLAVAVGAALIALQIPIELVAFALLDGSTQVEALAAEYFDIRIWAAPATLANYAILGWFIGLGRTDIGLILQLVLNISNIVLDAFFVLVLEWDVQGVAFGTLLAEYGAAAVGVLLALRYLATMDVSMSRNAILDAEKIRRTVLVNRDIMIRSLALIAAFVWFVSRGAVQGDVILAANAVLLNFVSFGAFFLDGLAFAAEALVGRAIGAEQRSGLSRAVRMTTSWAAATALVVALVVAAFGALLIDVLTVDAGARLAAREYLPWVIAAPLLGVWSFQLDGIFIGATRTVDMRNAMIQSLMIFIAAWWLLQPLGNHGLWAAFSIHYVARCMTLMRYYPGLVASVPDSP